MTDNASRLAVRRERPLAGILLMIAAVFMFGVLDIQAKYLSQFQDPVQVAWARYFGHFALMTLVLWPKFGRRLLATRRPGLQLVRSLLLMLCTVLFFTAIAHMPLADAVAISFVVPMIVTALSVPLLGEAVGLRRWAAVLVGFVGVLIILRPGLGVMHWAASLLLVMAVSFAFFQIITRKLASEGEDPLATLYYSALIGTAGLSLALPFVWQPVMAWWPALMLSSLGIWAGLGHYCLIRAHEMAPVSVLSPLLYMSLIWGALFGYLIFGDVVDGYTLVGALVLISTGLYIVYREGLRRGV